MRTHAEQGTRRLFKAGTGGLFAAIVAIVICETPLLAALLIGIGASAGLGQVSGWLDRVAMILVIASVALLGTAIYRRGRKTS